MQQALLREDSFLFYITCVYYCFVIRVDIREKREGYKIVNSSEKEVMSDFISASPHENREAYTNIIRTGNFFLNSTSK